MYSSTGESASNEIQDLWDDFVRGTPGNKDGGKFFHFIHDAGMDYAAETDRATFELWQAEFNRTGKSNPALLSRDAVFLRQSHELVAEQGGSSVRGVVVNLETIGERGGFEHWMLDGLAKLNGHPEIGKEDVRVVFEGTAASRVVSPERRGADGSTHGLDQRLLTVEFGVFQAPQGDTAFVQTDTVRSADGDLLLELSFWTDTEPEDRAMVQTAVDFMKTLESLNYVTPAAIVKQIENSDLRAPKGLRSEGPGQFGL